MAKLSDEQYAAWEQAVSDAKDARDHLDSAVAQRRGYAAAHAAAAQHKSHAEAYYAARIAYSKAANFAGRSGNPLSLASDREDNPSGSLAAFAVGAALIGAAVFLLGGKKTETPLVGLGSRADLDSLGR